MLVGTCKTRTIVRVRCDALMVVSLYVITLIQAKPGHCFSERNQDPAAARHVPLPLLSSLNNHE